jgi:hypothetical protein
MLWLAELASLACCVAFDYAEGCESGAHALEAQEVSEGSFPRDGRKTRHPVPCRSLRPSQSIRFALLSAKGCSPWSTRWELRISQDPDSAVCHCRREIKDCLRYLLTTVVARRSDVQFRNRPKYLDRNQFPSGDTAVPSQHRGVQHRDRAGSWAASPRSFTDTTSLEAAGKM